MPFVIMKKKITDGQIPTDLAASHLICSTMD